MMKTKHTRRIGGCTYNIGNRGIERTGISYAKSFWKNKGYNIRVIKQKPNEYNVWIVKKGKCRKR